MSCRWTVLSRCRRPRPEPELGSLMLRSPDSFGNVLRLSEIGLCWAVKARSTHREELELLMSHTPDRSEWPSASPASATAWLTRAT